MSEHSDAQPEWEAHAIVLHEQETALWDTVSSLLGQPVGVCYLLCALSGAEHYLAEIGHLEHAAMAGAFLRVFAEHKGIEVRESEVELDTRKQKQKGKQREREQS